MAILKHTIAEMSMHLTHAMQHAMQQGNGSYSSGQSVEYTLSNTQPAV